MIGWVIQWQTQASCQRTFLLEISANIKAQIASSWKWIDTLLPGWHWKIAVGGPVFELKKKKKRLNTLLSSQIKEFYCKSKNWRLYTKPVHADMPQHHGPQLPNEQWVSDMCKLTWTRIIDLKPQSVVQHLKKLKISRVRKISALVYLRRYPTLKSLRFVINVMSNQSIKYRSLSFIYMINHSPRW